MQVPAFFVAAAVVSGLLVAQTPPAHYAWSGDAVHVIRLTFRQPDFWSQLEKNYLGPEEDSTYLDASLEWGPHRFTSVGVRYKGSSSYNGARNSLKKPFRIKLNEFVRGQGLDGVASFNLNNGWGDPSLVREPLYYEMARSAGLKAPRTNYAALYVNEQYIGLYVLGEVVNGDFLRNYFGSNEAGGNLYKGNFGASFADLGDDKARYKLVWEKQTNEEADDWSDLIALCKLIDRTPASELKARLEEVMDIDSVLTALALDNMTVNLDSYAGLAQNFNIYRRPSDRRWVWLVWDPSLAFAGLTAGLPNLAQLPIEFTATNSGLFTGSGATRPLATKLWSIPEYRQRYRQIYRDLLMRIYNRDRLLARANELRTMIEPYVALDEQLLNPFAAFANAMSAPLSGGPADVAGLETFLTARVDWLRTQFAAVTFPTVVLRSSPARLDMTGPGTQRVDLSFTGVNTPPTWSLLARTDNGGSWLTPDITGGPLPGGFTITVDARNLANGYYSGAVTVFLAGGQEVVIPVSLTIGSLPTPTMSAVVNAASYVDGPIAPRQIVTVFGTNLGTPGLQIRFDGTPGQLLYAVAGQAGVIVPSSISGKASVPVQAAYGTVTSPVVTKSAGTAAPGLFTADASGTGPGAILNQNGTLNGAPAPAAKGSTIVLFLTGGGTAMTSANTTVTIGGQTAAVVYAGVTPGIAGLQQVNATIPAGAPSGAQPVVVTVGGVASQNGVTAAVQ